MEVLFLTKKRKEFHNRFFALKNCVRKWFRIQIWRYLMLHFVSECIYWNGRSLLFWIHEEYGKSYTHNCWIFYQKCALEIINSYATLSFFKRILNRNRKCTLKFYYGYFDVIISIFKTLQHTVAECSRTQCLKVTALWVSRVKHPQMSLHWCNAARWSNWY